MLPIAVCVYLLLASSNALAQNTPTAASMLTGQSNSQAADEAAAEAAAAEEHADAEKAAEAVEESQPAAAPTGRRGERGCQDAQGNPREC